MKKLSYFPTIFVCLFLTLLSLPGCALFATAPEEDLYANAINEGHIVLGMPMGEVKRQWGEPEGVQFDGDPRQGNQKWVYALGLVSHYGLGNKREVFFERGHVIGWKTSSR
jgi:hypothetical protein